MFHMQKPSPCASEEGPTVIAIDESRHSQYAVKWAVENILRRNSPCVLIHVRTNCLHPNDATSVPKHGRPPTEEELHQFFLPFRGFCARKGILARELVLHDIDVPNALTCYINENYVNTVVVGASSSSCLKRRKVALPASLAKSLPGSCTLYVISKGKVQNIRPTGPPPNGRGSTPQPINDTITQLQDSPLDHPPKFIADAATEYINKKPCKDATRRQASNDWESLREIKDAALETSFKFNEDLVSPRGPRLSAASLSSINSSNRSSPANSTESPRLLGIELPDTSNGNQEAILNSDTSRCISASKNQKNLDVEIRKLKLELKKTAEQYGMVCREAKSAKHEAMKLEKFKQEKERERDIEKAKLAEEAAMASVKLERQKTKLAMESVEKSHRLAEEETQKRKLAEIRAKLDKEEKQRALNKANIQYRRYNITEIEVATNYFDTTRKIGEGGYGPVFKGVLDHTVVAIKVVRPDLSQGERQFQQEVDILSTIRHPHMVLLVGACPEFGCLVYEYMDNGSLEDRLFQKGRTPPIPWQVRFNIASEIATALLFLHQTRPEPLVHRDLKPANILLDRNYTSKIGDVGLARLVPPAVADKTTQYRLTAAAGTFCYIDPEYQKTGKLGVKSDIYSLGVLLLQMITARPPMGLSCLVEAAVERGEFEEVLDPSVPDWPVEEALSLATLALRCCELRRKDRPDLCTVILPELNRIRDFADNWLSNEMHGDGNPNA